MDRIRVIAKIGNTIHPKFGLLEKGKEYEIDEADFGNEIFEIIPHNSPLSKGEMKQGKKQKEE